MQLLFGRNNKPTLSIPNHLAVIMDGNGRWAKSKLLPRLEGHRAGGKAVRKLVESSLKLGIKYLTVYAFSSENWNRPKEEVSALMKLFEYYLANELELFEKHKVRLRAIGDRSRLTDSLLNLLQSAEEKTKDNDAMQFIIAVSYGGRDEIANASKQIAYQVLQNQLDPSTINSQTIQQNLYAPDLPDVDLIIRTSNEFRISNFLLWQSAYAEIVVSQCFWPDFNEAELEKCIAEYSKRTRKFGLTSEQLSEQKFKTLAVQLKLLIVNFQFSDLRKRILTATVLISIIILVEVLSKTNNELKDLFPTITFLFVLLCGYEFLNLCDKPVDKLSAPKKYFYFNILYFITFLFPVLFLFSSFFLSNILDLDFSIPKHSVLISGVVSIFLGLTTFTLLGQVSMDKAKAFVTELFCGLLLVSFGGASLFQLSILASHGEFFWLLFVVAANDIGAYFIGKLFGKNKISPYLSPKKTVEGSLGGLLIGIIVGYLTSFLVQFNISIFLMALLVGYAGQLCDLLESFAKRNAGVKDSSNLLPGHGGFLDRMDAVLGGAFILNLAIIYT